MSPIVIDLTVRTKRGERANGRFRTVLRPRVTGGNRHDGLTAVTDETCVKGQRVGGRPGEVAEVAQHFEGISVSVEDRTAEHHRTNWMKSIAE